MGPKNSDFAELKVTEAPALSVGAEVTAVVCKQGKGSIELTVNGGIPPYSFS